MTRCGRMRFAQFERLASMNVSTRRATTTDAEVACTVLRRSITECCVEDHHNNPELLSGWLQNKTPENVSAWFASKENFSVVAVSGQQVVGVGLLTENGNLALCYVLPEVRFTGAGKALLRAMESHAVQIRLNEIHLSSTATAKAFYLRNCFVQSGPPEVEFGIQAFPLVKRLGTNNAFNTSTQFAARPSAG